MIEIRWAHEYRGPNPWAPGAALVGVASQAARWPSERWGEDVRSACARLRTAFPDWLGDDAPSAGDALLLAARSVAHWSLGALNEVRGYLHDAGARRGADGAVQLWVGFHHPRITGAAVRLGVNLLQEAALSEVFHAGLAQARLEELWKHCQAAHPDWQAHILMEAARARDIPVMRLVHGARYWHYGWGVRGRTFMENLSNADGEVGSAIQRSKSLTKSVLGRLGFPVAPGRTVHTPDELEAAACEVGWPCVLKPENLSQTKGVTTHIRDMQGLRKAFQAARRVTNGALIVERHVEGHEYRLLVHGGRFMAALRREVPAVTGDGRRTIAELADELNRQRPRNLVKARYLLPVDTGEAMARHLATQGLQPGSVPREGQRVTLHHSPVRYSGADSIDDVQRTHPAVKQRAEMIATTIGLNLCGLDYITPDITQPEGTFLEVNVRPGLAVLVTAGHDAEDFGARILGERTGRIPFRMVVVAASEMDAALKSLQERAWPAGCAWVCASEAGIGAVRLDSKASHHAQAEAVLFNACVERVLAVCSAQSLMASGMLVDRAQEVAVCVDLPAEWMRVLRERSASLVTLRDWAECVREGWDCVPHGGDYDYP